MKNKIAAYKEILEVVQKHSEVFEEDRIIPRTASIEGIIRTLEVTARFGIPVNELSSRDWFRIEGHYDDWLVLGLYGEKHERTIPWPDDNRQPDDEWLFRIGFSTGAYIFGDSYPNETFQAFFEELKSYSPKYIDSANHCLYFAEDNAKVVYDNFWDIYNKYKAQVGEELKAKRKKELEEELAKLS